MAFDIAALAATQLIFCLYGAGIRRPFGSLKTIMGLPRSLRMSRWVVVFDCLFVCFVAAMWVLLAANLGIWMFLGSAFIFYVVAEALSYRISILPSLYLVGALAVFACFWVTQRLAQQDMLLLPG